MKRTRMVGKREWRLDGRRHAFLKTSPLLQTLRLARISSSPSAKYHPETINPRAGTGKLEVAFLFEMCEDSGAEEDLGLSDAVKILIQFQDLDHLLARLLPVHEALGNHAGSEDFVSEWR